MKKILYLTKYELRQIRKSATLTAIVLSIFLGALFGIISVQTDMMDNMCAHLDKEYPGEVSIYTQNATYNDVADFVNGLLMDDNVFEGINVADIVRPDGTVFKVMEEITDDPIFGSYYHIWTGAAIYPNNAMNELLGRYDNCIIEGRWVVNSFEMCVASVIFEELNVALGEVVTIEGYEFTLVGVYDRDLLTEDGSCPIDSVHIITVDDNTPTYRWELNFDTAKQAFEAYRQLQRRGIDVYLGWYEGYYTDLTQMRAAFTAVDVVLTIVIIISLYSLVSILFRQRKTQICRLKILGASDNVIAGIYCGTVIFLMLAVVLLATAIGIAFNYYFMGLCAVMLQYNFVSHFNVYAPFVAFAVFCLVTYLIWLVVNRRTKNNLASEIRYE